MGPDVADVLDQLVAVRVAVAAEADALCTQWGVAESPFAASAHNLAAYVALRHRDLRDLQDTLTDLGLSSLGRCEPHVLATIDAVIGALAAMVERHDLRGGHPGQSVADARRLGEERLEANHQVLFGREAGRRHTRIMVTLPSEAATDPGLAVALVHAGMDTARINCAHDDPAAWAAMAGHVRQAAADAGRTVTVFMDLAGPKLRTGLIAPGIGVVRLNPRRDEQGHVIEAALVVLDGTGASGRRRTKLPSGEVDLPRLSVPEAWVERLEPGDRIRFLDLPGRKRQLTVVERRGPLEVVAAVGAASYLAEGTRLELVGRKKVRAAEVGPIEPPPAAVRLSVGDLVRLTADDGPGRGPIISEDGELVQPPAIPIAQPEVLHDLRPGERVLFDDGKIEAVVIDVDPSAAVLEVRSARTGGTNLRAEKGVNFPDSRLTLPSLTVKDLDDLAHVVQIADVVGCSFVRTPDDMAEVVRALDRAGGHHLGVVAKIETDDAVENLPEIIVAGAEHHAFGVMIARGDLAVEVGWEALAEAQDRVLWFAEAAHVPVVWATQVLESMVKTGRPSRAEMTDAAMSERAECVMLNKGPYVVEAVEVLHEVLRRMRPFVHKKRDLLPAL